MIDLANFRILLVVPDYKVSALRGEMELPPITKVISPGSSITGKQYDSILIVYDTPLMESSNTYRDKITKWVDCALRTSLKPHGKLLELN